MLIHVDSPNINNNNVAFVTCTDFFAGNRLVFQANNSATVNVWTNLGQPVFTTGVWNSNNYTTTLTLDASSTAEINWFTGNNITIYTDAHSSVSPSNVTVANGENQTFNFSAMQGYRFNVSIDDAPQGQIANYTFNNVIAPHMVNVTSSKLAYTITALTDAHSTISPGNVSVSYGENQLFNITADSGYRISHVYVDGNDQGKIISYNFTSVQSNHTISVSSESTDASTLTPSPTPSASASPTTSHTTSPTSTTENSPFTTEIVLIAAVAIALIIAVFAFAFKKGYITIEVVDEENPQENSDDYTI
jgi:hypothetical protein